MKVDEIFVNRYSCRQYKSIPVEWEKIETCLEAARLAPSACNSQPWTFIVITDPELKDKVARETYDIIISINKWTHQAPVIIVIVNEAANLTSQIGGRIKKRDFTLFDIGIVAEHFCLQATKLGLGTCLIGWFNEKKIKELLNIPKNKSIGLLITLGYPENEKIKEKKRKSLNEIYKVNYYI